MVPPRPLGILVVVGVIALSLAACANDPSSAASVGETGEISIEQLHADVALFGFLTGLSGAPCGTPVGNETQDAACARFALANDIREELAKAYATEHDLRERVPGARYLRTTQTLNLDIGRVPGSELPSLVERGLVRAMGEDEVVATMTP